MWRLILLLSVLWTWPARADDPLWRIEFRDDIGAVREVQGRILVEAEDGGLLIEDRARQLWNIPPTRQLARENADAPFTPLTVDEWRAALPTALGMPTGNPAVAVVVTPHYVVATQGDPDVAARQAVLLELLLRGFVESWTERGVTLEAPDGLLPVLIFTRRDQYTDYVTQDAGPQLMDNPGYYSMRTNRIVLLADGAGASSATQARSRTSSDDTFVRTLVHEGIHQLAYNCGLHTRFADNPVWLTEGMAMVYEALAPDLGRTLDEAGADTIEPPPGLALLCPVVLKAHPQRLQTFRASLPRRPAGALASLVENDERFRSAETAGLAYAEAWALTHLLLSTREDEYVAYLQRLQGRAPLTWDSSVERTAAFEEAFGPPDELHVELLRHVRRLRR